MQLDLNNMAYRQFGGLEQIGSEERANADFLAGYVEKLFASNGLEIAKEDLRIVDWLNAPDRAPYANMANQLWQDLAPQIDPNRVGLVLMAHWMPDVHLGTSVTNYLMHIGNITDGIGFSLSECGTTAPFVALDWMNRYITRYPHKTGLLLVCDQRNLMYRSVVHDALDPVNIGCLIQMSNTRGLHFVGLERSQSEYGTSNLLHRAAERFGMNPARTTLVGSTLPDLPRFADRIEACPRQLCAAPFVAIAEAGQRNTDYLILTETEGQLLVCGLTQYPTEITCAH